MPGGTKAAYENLEPILTKIAAQVDDGPCVTLVLVVAGHFVKWFTGIEYGDMQLIAETYDLLRMPWVLIILSCMRFLMVEHTEELNSYLIEITADIFNYIDPDTGRPGRCDS